MLPDLVIGQLDNKLYSTDGSSFAPLPPVKSWKLMTEEEEQIIIDHQNLLNLCMTNNAVKQAYDEFRLLVKMAMP